MLLALDVGNTNVTIGAFEGAHLTGHWRLRTIREQTADEWGILLRNLFTLSSLDLGAVDGVVTFTPDGSAGGRIASSDSTHSIRVERLSPHLREPVDFLKLNIEGQELPVLAECAVAGTLSNVRQMVVEYHGWAGGKQSLGDLLNLLDSEGFRYFVHDFDSETCTTTKPPFRHRPRSHWFCLVHAQREAA